MLNCNLIIYSRFKSEIIGIYFNSMKFRTEIFPEKPDFTIEHKDKIITFGSCFAENIALYFQRNKFNVFPNPFGVLYNPVSILNSINIIKSKKVFTKDDLFFDQSEWHSFYHHSDFSHHNHEICLQKINETTTDCFDRLKNADVIIITFGTAFVYELKESAQVVSNCHKIPQEKFIRKLLTLDETMTAVTGIIETISELNKKVKLIFTVSPVRHWKEGAVNNQLSKATLLLTVKNVIENYPACDYFPSYEILIDDLRDYRYYEKDLLHPNEQATDYIWEKFSSVYFSEDCQNACDEISKLISAVNHKPRNIYSGKHQSFVKKQIEYLVHLKQKYPHIDFADEEEILNMQLQNNFEK